MLVHTYTGLGLGLVHTYIGLGLGLVHTYMYMIKSCTCICKGRQDNVRHSPKADSEKKH